MDNSNYSSLYKDPPLLIYNLLKDTYGGTIKAYYLGSPTEIPEAAYPCIIVQSIQSKNTINGAASQTDNVNELIHIHLLENAKDHYSGELEVDTTLRALYQKIQGRDPATGFYLPGTAMFALRTNISLANTITGVNTVIDQDVNIDYDILPRADQPTILQAMITVLTTERVQIPNRV